MHRRNYVIPMPAIEVKQALTDIIESIAAGNKALSRILDAESRLLERVKNEVNCLDTLNDVNNSINSIIKSITIIQLINKYEVEDTLNGIADDYVDMEE